MSFTIAAYDMAGAAPLVEAADTLGGLLATHLDGIREPLAASLASSQVMAISSNRDLADWAAALAGTTGVSELDDQLALVAALATDPAYLLAFTHATSVDPRYRLNDLDDATGTSIYLPAPAQTDELDLATYGELAFSQRSEAGWDEFLLAWLGDAPLRRAGGDFRVELSWTLDGEPGEPAPEVDLDLFLYEPGSGFVAPYYGAETSDGLLSLDSLDSGEAQEWYEANPEVAAGTFLVFVRYQDPGGAAPPVEATVRFTDALWADNDTTFSAIVDTSVPCFLGEGLLSFDVRYGFCTDFWFAGMVIRDGERHPFVGDIYDDFSLSGRLPRFLPGSALRPLAR